MMKHSLRIFKRLTDFHIQYILTHCLRFYFHGKLQLPLKTRKQKAEKQHSDIIANDFSLALPETKFSCSGDYTEINFAFYESETLNIFNFFIFFFLIFSRSFSSFTFCGKNGSLMKLLSQHPTFTKKNDSYCGITEKTIAKQRLII